MSVHGCVSCRYPGCRSLSCPICHPKEHEHGQPETFHAFVSNSAAANQAKFIEAVKRLLWEIHDTEADKEFVFQEATAAVEEAMKEMGL